MNEPIEVVETSEKAPVLMMMARMTAAVLDEATEREEQEMLDAEEKTT